MSKKAYARSSGGRSSGGSSGEKTLTVTGLSDFAKQMLNAGSTYIKFGSDLGAKDKMVENYKQNLAALVSNGQISPEEARYIYNELGL